MLNPSQQLAVDHTTGPLLILAGAGAGKTHTLTERIATLIQERGAAPESILAVTFTNKAAKEMRERIGKKLGRDTTNMSPYRTSGFPLVGTFHSVGIFFLRSFIEHIGYDPKFVIYDEDDKLRLIKSLIKARDLDEKEITSRAVIGAISQAKNQGLSAAKYDTIVNNYFQSMVRDIYVDYEKALRENNALDFDDILLRTHDLLMIPEVLERLHNRYEYVFVDEYQDTNDIQYKIIKLLASKSRNLSVVGDDWQGIYGWRGANIKNILSFQKDFPGAVVVKLEQNYRSTKTIISGANAVIKCNKEALDKTLWTDNMEGEKIKLIEAISEKQEAELIVKEIQEGNQTWRVSQKRSNLSESWVPKWGVRNGYDEWGTENWVQRTSFSEAPDYSKWAILYRTNSQSRLIEEALIRAGIQYKIYGGVRFYERKEVKDILAYMRLIFNPLDTMSLRRIINVPSRKIGEKSVETFLEYIHNFRAPFCEITDGIDEMDELTPQARRGIAGFSGIYRELIEYLQTHSIKELMEEIIKKIQYIDYLRHEYGEQESESKEENLKEFINMASRYDGMDSREALMMFLEDIALITDTDRDNPEQNNYVSMMTIHSAKGLEFENVIIAGAEEGLFPHSRTLMEPKEIEEERRLMYVAMTRAKHSLTITRARERYNFGNYSANPASRFLKEIPAELTELKAIEVKNFFGGFGSGISYPTFDTPSHGTPEKLTEKKRSVTSNDPSSFSLGERVRHVEFGAGTIVSISWPIAEIAFGWGKGIKKMHLGIAPIEKGG